MTEHSTNSTQQELSMAIANFDVEVDDPSGEQQSSSGLLSTRRMHRAVHRLALVFIYGVFIFCDHDHEGCVKETASGIGPDLELAATCDFTFGSSRWQAARSMTPSVWDAFGLRFAHAPAFRHHHESLLRPLANVPVVNAPLPRPVEGVSMNIAASPSLPSGKAMHIPSVPDRVRRIPFSVMQDSAVDAHEDPALIGPAPARVPEQPHAALYYSPGMGLASTIMRGASQGAANAAVAATLAAFTEPVVNRILVQRIGFRASMKQMECKKIFIYWQTTMLTNMIKFPLFEALNAAMEFVPFGTTVRGIIAGVAFTTLVLPLTNYRFCKSMDLPVTRDVLFKAYLPTLVRDVTYATSRMKILKFMALAFPATIGKVGGRAAILAFAVFWSCIFSSPANELRGYFFQPKQKRKSLKEFFRPKSFAISTMSGSVVGGLAMGIGVLMTSTLRSAVALMKH